jgi:hypothetical protein
MAPKDLASSKKQGSLSSDLFGMNSRAMTTMVQQIKPKQACNGGTCTKFARRVVMRKI